MSWKESPLKDVQRCSASRAFFPFPVAFTGLLTHTNFRIQSEFPRTDYSIKTFSRETEGSPAGPFFFFLIKICNQHQLSEEKDEKGKLFVPRLAEVGESPSTLTHKATVSPCLAPTLAVRREAAEKEKEMQVAAAAVPRRSPRDNHFMSLPNSFKIVHKNSLV